MSRQDNTTEDGGYSYSKAVREQTEIEAYLEFSEAGDLKRIKYPNGEVAKGSAAGVLLIHDIKPVCDFERVSFDETPFQNRGGH